MKFRIILLNLFFPLFALGQSSYNKDSLAGVLINDLKDSWNLGINEDIKQPLNIRVYNKFKSLFDTTATIDDEFNANFRFVQYDPKAKKSSYQYELSKAKPFDVYAHDIAMEVRLMKIDVVGEQKLVSTIGNEFIYEVTRKVDAEKSRKFVLEDAAKYYKREFENRKIDEIIDKAGNADQKEEIKNKIKNNSLYNDIDSVYKFQSYNTLKVFIMFINDSTPRIYKIEAREIDTFNYKNDQDQDGILDYEENDSVAKITPGDFTANGYPDFDFDGTPDKADRCPEIYGVKGNSGCPSTYFNNNFSIFAYTGLMINNCKITLPKPDQLGYSNVDVLESKNGSFKNPSFTSTISSTFGADFNYYFGKKEKHMGISLGINYCGYNATYNIEEPVVIAFKSNDGVNDYRRRITIRDSSEEILNYHVLNFPLLFRYRTKIGRVSENKVQKWSMEYSIGPSFVYFNNSSSYNVYLDFEGLYQIDPATNDFYYLDNFSQNPPDWNILLTAEDINNQSATPGAELVFNTLNSSGYDFATNKNYKGQDKKATRYSIALNLNFDFSYYVSEYMDVKFGVGFMAAPSLAEASSYTPMDKTTDEYNSLYRSNTKSIYASYGLHAGIVIVLDKLDKTLGL